MLGRNSYTKEEFDQCQTAIDRQVAAYRTLVKAAATDKKVSSALETLEPLFFNHMVLALDRYFVHRIRPVTGKDGNPLNEVEMLAESLINNNGVLRESKVIKLIPEQSVMGLRTGDTISLSEQDFERLSAAFLADLERKFL